jgi:hypothetical protein
LVVLDFGSDLKEKEREGLEKYTAFVQQRIEWESQRQEEKRQSGITVNSDSIELRRFKEFLKKAEDKLNGNITPNGNQGATEPQRSSVGSPKVSDGNNKKSA